MSADYLPYLVTLVAFAMPMSELERDISTVQACVLVSARHREKYLLYNNINPHY